ncbi:MAG TPA: sigma-70 family RNA polymerase sigma factor [Bacteroidia bacterium]|jgi:RNA polymerase sigma factor (sigma-70 family)|nr:sigma-70 family RNA polymerase sigma factor [Bacteroidia bacterium]
MERLNTKNKGMIAVGVSQRNKVDIIQTVQDYGNRLFSFIRNRVKSDEDAQDILQDVWFRLSNVSEAEPIEQVGSWLFTVARNRITDMYRKQKPSSLDDFVYEDEDGEINYKDILLSEFKSPEDEELKKMFWNEFSEALDELPKEQKDAFIQNEMEDKTFREMAEKSGESIKTLISRKRYAVLHLRKKLDSLYSELITR